MDAQQNTALTRALTEVPGPLPASGVIHIVIPHTSRFTVVGNHLAQHPGLSSTAVGIAVRIQSLPQGADVGIKALAARFPEGEIRIAAALRELEAHGYLQRARVRLPSGRIVTRTVFCNQPTALLRPRTAAPQPPPAPLVPAPAPKPEPPAPQADARQAPAPQADAPQAAAPQAAAALAVPETPGPAPLPEPADRPSAAPEPRPPVVPMPVMAPPPAPASPPFVPLSTAPKPPPRPLPEPRELTSELHRAAAALLSDLRRHAPQFVLSESDVRHLVPGVAAWLEREAHPDTIRHALTDDPPQPLRQPAKLLRHRLTALLPPPLPGALDLAPVRRAPAVPLQTCDGCERAFRSPVPGHCRGCRAEHARSAA
ncbi:MULTISPECIES: hypothetical protein [unclassified Streptomyces]|uniref:hypothetical protein n=1 Tax=unclassified Streptomyces TaxID=2593676 RepID=UPI00093CA9EE|nr:hypothetical protein [Streptomyces sp. TSRI0281]OKI48114.1 hypothetical protein A6A29_03410 [Streptomyces sp. TSRI0281]